MIGDHPYITSAKRWVGWVRKVQFLLIYSTIYAEVGRCVGPKKAINMLTLNMDGPRGLDVL